VVELVNGYDWNVGGGPNGGFFIGRNDAPLDIGGTVVERPLVHLYRHLQDGKLYVAEEGMDVEVPAQVFEQQGKPFDLRWMKVNTPTLEALEQGIVAHVRDVGLSSTVNAFARKNYLGQRGQGRSCTIMLGMIPQDFYEGVIGDITRLREARASQ